MTRDRRKDLVDAARALNRAGGNVGTAGNLSLREGGGMLITPSGVDYTEMQPEDIVAVDAQGGHRSHRPPSSEWRFHLEIYRHFPQAMAVVHTHSKHATALSCLRRNLPAFHYEVALAGGPDIRCADYATYGSEELARNTVQALEGRKACLLANHGMVCHGPGLQAAMALAEKVEHLAGIYLQCLAAGEPVVLDEAEMASVADKFRDYGRHEDDPRR